MTLPPGKKGKKRKKGVWYTKRWTGGCVKNPVGKKLPTVLREGYVNVKFSRGRRYKRG
jgi:hypothetical protein